MAYYAFLDENNVVTEVISGKDESNFDWEQYYAMKRGQVCKRTSYNTHGGVHALGGTPFRKNYAGKGYIYNSDLDAFIPPQPFGSWSLNNNTCLWEAPLPEPSDNNVYYWDEDSYQSDNTTGWVVAE